MSDNLLLKTRVALLYHAVDEVEQVLTVLKANRQALTDSANAITQAQVGVLSLGVDKLGPVRDVLSKYAPTVRDNQARDSLTAVLNYLNTVDQVIAGITTNLTNASQTVGALNERGVFRDEARQADEQKLQARVTGDAGAYRGTLKNVSDELTTNASKVASTRAWESFCTKVQAAGDDLFGDYLDLLGGIAIRERGIGLRKGTSNVYELCMMADWLIREELLEEVDRAALTVPSQSDAVRFSAWPVMRIRFTQWSIWGMPLEAHQFGQLQAARAVEERIEESEWGADAVTTFGRDGFRTLIADAYATWALGPAYACALIFLRLNPPADAVKPDAGAQSADAAKPLPATGLSDADRAEMVRVCLRDQVTPPGRDPVAEATGYKYTEFLKPIFDEWKSALALRNATPVTAARSAYLAKLGGRTRERLEVKQPFSLNDWQVSREAWEPLRNNQTEINPPIEMRHLLNAAWYGLLQGRDDGADIGAASATIEALALAHGRRIADPTGSLLPSSERMGMAPGSNTGAPMGAGPLVGGPLPPGGAGNG